MSTFGDEIRSRKVRIRYVSQGDLFRLETEGSSTAGQRIFSNDRIRAFDGETTRLFDQNAVGNIIRGRREDENAIRPHMLLLQFMNFMVPLSTYLEGEAAMRAHPSANWDETFVLRNRYEGEEEVDGLQCHKVSITTVLENGYEHDRWDLWLAEEQNSIPVRMHGYTFRFAEDVPIVEGEVTKWLEVEPGVWFPQTTEITAYNGIALQQTGKRTPQWRQAYTVEHASLQPEYDAAFFSEVEFPEGTAVYHVEDDEIREGSIQGAPAATGGHAGSASWSGLVWMNVAAAGVIILLAFSRKFGRRPGTPDGSRA